MSDFDSYADLLRRDPSERLAWLAHSVQTPFTAIHRTSDSQEDRVYALTVRDLGERLASDVVLGGNSALDGSQVLVKILAEAVRFNGRHGDRFLQDELAVAHAAMVYKVCVSEFETCLEVLEV